MKKTCSILIITLSLTFQATAQTKPIRGQVLSASSGQPLPGATIRVKHTNKGTTSGQEGDFTFSDTNAPFVLVTSFIGYQTKELNIDQFTEETIVVTLSEDETLLNDVVVSSGYQTLPKERATGSFVQIDNDLLNRSVSPDILSRLEDIVPGLVFNRSGAARADAQSRISIRGQSTLFAREDPLIVLDNFPFNGDITSINPNDVESITILKDAAAASIWGAQAANGVIVIKTKKGKASGKTNFSFNAFTNLEAKPDLYYQPVISPSEYIDLETMLFDNGYYRAIEADRNRQALTPAVELMIAARDGLISQQEAQRQIQLLRTYDTRADQQQYRYQTGLQQQYALSLSGATENTRYRIAYGFDRQRAVNRGDHSQRHTLHYAGGHQLLKGKMNVQTDLFFSGTATHRNAVTDQELYLATGRPLYPYARFADPDGNPLTINHGYRQAFIEKSMQEGLLDWTYAPLRELDQKDNRRSATQYRANTAVQYHLLEGLTAEVRYQYEKGFNQLNNRQLKDSWYVRDLVNRFTSVNADGQLIRPVPYGDILRTTHAENTAHFLRSQITYQKDWGQSHSVNLLLGAETRRNSFFSKSAIYYGYNPELAISQLVDHHTRYPSYVNPMSQNNAIPHGNALSGKIDHHLSYYFNGSYSFADKYLFSASARLDQSNLFGVKSNQKGVPLYSTGVAWKIHKEDFYQLSFLPYLNFRLTYGYNGNVHQNLSAYTTAAYISASLAGAGLPYAMIANPPNPSLRWERVRMTNLAIDFSGRNARLKGTVEFYLKNGLDLIGTAPVAPQTGILTLTANTAQVKGQGLEISLSSRNTIGLFRWETDAMLSRISDRVTRYLAKPANIAGTYLVGGTNFPTEGKPLYAVYSYRWAGLDPADGAPLGYLEGEPSRDYSAIKSRTTLDELDYNGPSRPVTFGSLRNTFSIGNWSLSANISYRLGYVVRVPSVLYSSILTGNGGHADYRNRWKTPGDEQITPIPSLPSQQSPLRDELYQFSQILVEKGDHIRLQDINLSYHISKPKPSAIPDLKIYVYLNNIGLLYRSNTKGLDPDYVTGFPPARTAALGLKFDF